jgi:hypothetical protein
MMWHKNNFTRLLNFVAIVPNGTNCLHQFGLLFTTIVTFHNYNYSPTRLWKGKNKRGGKKTTIFYIKKI